MWIFVISLNVSFIMPPKKVNVVCKSEFKGPRNTVDVETKVEVISDHETCLCLQSSQGAPLD